MLLSSQNFHQNEELTKLMKIDSKQEGKNVIDKMHELSTQFKNNVITDQEISKLNLSTDLYYKNIDNGLWFFEEFWVVSSRTLLVDVRLPLNFVAKIFQFVIILLFMWLL
jgi:hypothetical protein